MSSSAAPSPSDIEIGIICALPKEANAVRAIMDVPSSGHQSQNIRSHSSSGSRPPGDSNSYTYGKIGPHHVVMAHVPGMGKVATSNVAANMARTFGKMQLALLVGLCGGVPDPQGESTPGTKLGDVVIGDSVAQYDLGKQLPDDRVRKRDVGDVLGRPDNRVRSFAAKLRSVGEELTRQTGEALAELVRGSPDLARKKLWDVVYEPDYWHLHHSGERSAACRACVPGQKTCDAARAASCETLGCESWDDRNGVKRATSVRASSLRPAVHFGTVACGDTVMKSGEHRDRVARDTGAVALEMESAGVWDNLPCLVVKAVCDYADSHKSKAWQEVASLAAAVCAKVVLEQWTGTENASTLPEVSHGTPRTPSLPLRIRTPFPTQVIG